MAVDDYGAIALARDAVNQMEAESVAVTSIRQFWRGTWNCREHEADDS